MNAEFFTFRITVKCTWLYKIIAWGMCPGKNKFYELDLVFFFLLAASISAASITDDAGKIALNKIKSKANLILKMLYCLRNIIPLVVMTLFSNFYVAVSQFLVL